MAEVATTDLRKAFGAAEVLHGLDLAVPDGDFAVLVGPSGCGKSTLLRMIAGLEEVTSGTIRIGERVVNHLPPSKRDIAMVFQNYALYPHKTVGANMAFALRMRRMARGEIEERVRRAAEILGLTPYLDRYPRALSGGQRQRVAMGRAIVRDPEVFLFDEPLSNLDAQLRVQMRTEIRELHQRLATTTIYVTHDQIEAMTMADRIVVMRAGRIEQVGSPLDLYDEPANRFVASFIGSPAMNLIPGRLRTEGGAAVEVAGASLSVPAARGLEDGRAVVLGVRPEHLALAAEDARDALPVTVAVVEPTGAETHVVARLAASGEDAAAEVIAAFRERQSLRPGQPIRLRPDPARCHVFDAEDGARLT